MFHMFHLAYTRDCARFHECRRLSRCNERDEWDALEQTTVVGAQYRYLVKSGMIHKNHAYNVVRSSDELIVVENAFDGGAILEETTLNRAEMETLLDLPSSCMVRAVRAVR